MKRGIPFYTLVVLMCVLSLNMPLQCLAQQQNTVALDAKTDAKYDAEDDVNTALWLAAGGILGVAGPCLLSRAGERLNELSRILYVAGPCLFGAVAVGGAYVYQPVPPADRLLGKSAEYVNFYTDAYKARMRRLQVVAATKGALGGSAVFFLLGTFNIKPWANFVIW